jgi:multidrug efflux pump subunit AcrB
LSKASQQPRISIVYAFPSSVGVNLINDALRSVIHSAEETNAINDPHFFQGSGFVGVDVHSKLTEEQLRAFGDQWVEEHLHASEIHPDSWRAVFVRDPKDTEKLVREVEGDKYTYRELDNFTDLIGRTLQGAPEVAKMERKGVLPEQIYLTYSQERLASYGLKPANLKNLLSTQNITLASGQLEVGDINVVVETLGKFTSPQQIGNVIVSTSAAAGESPVYLRDLVDTSRGYQSPPRYLNYSSWLDKAGVWHRGRAITLGVQMKEGEQINVFGANVDKKLAAVRQYLPEDLIISRTSDQPLQVKENIGLFMDALYEAIILVVLVSWLGFWEWRSALLMAIAIPVTLAITFGGMSMLGMDIQQVSVATLIIALGLLVDDPVLAGDSIKRALAEGYPNIIAAWLGPTKLATAIMYATVTNIVAYLPFLLVTGSTGDFLHSLPIVMTCALVASRLVSMTFLPLLAYYFLRPEKKPERTIEEMRSEGFYGWYARIARSSIEHRWKFFIGSLAFLIVGVLIFSRLNSAFFPEDVQYWSYIDVWLPNDANFSATNKTARRVEEIVRDEAEKYGREHAHDGAAPALRYITTFVGGGGPRFWFSASPQPQQLNYAQVLIEVTDKEMTPKFVNRLQPILSSRIPGARLDARQLLTNPIDYPIEIRISSTADVSAAQEQSDIRQLRQIAAKVQGILRSSPLAERTRNEWGDEQSQLTLDVDADRANLAGVTNMDVANSSAAALSGTTVAALQEGDKQIPIVTRMRMDERARLSDIQNLYVYASQDQSKIPLTQVANVSHEMVTGRIVRMEQFRTINVRSFPIAGHLSSEVIKEVMPKLEALESSLPAGYEMRIGGEYYKTKSGFKNLGIVMLISSLAVFLALVFQFKNAIKPLLVLAAAPYGMIGAFVALWIMHEPFGFMAFLGVASLVGVIVSHSIVLFDYIEERHAMGDDFENALIDAGILRLRPVLITVFATVLALLPLALHGGPLWKPLCYAQIGGLLIATVVTKLQVPVMYAIFVLDLKILDWNTGQERPIATPINSPHGIQPHHP